MLKKEERGVRMPEKLKKYFWDTKFEELDIKKIKDI